MRKGIILTFILLGVGIVGAVFFFPINFDDQYTCLYHRIFAPEYHHGFSKEPRLAGNAAPVGEYHKDEQNEMLHSDLVKKYILPFGIIWWISLIAIALAFFWLKHGPRKENVR